MDDVDGVSWYCCETHVTSNVDVCIFQQTDPNVMLVILQKSAWRTLDFEFVWGEF